MTLANLTLPISYADAQAWALVFTPQLAARLAELLGGPVHFADDCISDAAIAQGKALKPGEVLLLENLRYYRAAVAKSRKSRRLMLPADILPEIDPGGLLHAMWEAADKAVLMQAVEVLPWAEAVALLPPVPQPV